MTSDEIHQALSQFRIGENPTNASEIQLRFLGEIAYQLAVMNEREDVPKLNRNPFGEALADPVRAGSDTEVRVKVAMPLPLPKCAGRDVRMAITHSSIWALGMGEVVWGRCRRCGWTRDACMAADESDTEREVKERTTPPDPQTSPIQTKE